MFWQRHQEVGGMMLVRQRAAVWVCCSRFSVVLLQRGTLKREQRATLTSFRRSPLQEDEAGGFPAVAERWIGHGDVEARLLRRVLLPHYVPLIELDVSMEEVELRVIHPVQRHVHAGEVVGGNVYGAGGSSCQHF